MQYQGQTDYDHQGPSPRRGVILCNLGTPDAPPTPELRRYLKEFLSDPRVAFAGLQPGSGRWGTKNYCQKIWQ